MSVTDGELARVQHDATDRAIAEHGGVFPAGFRFYWRRYGRYGGRWRGVDPHGCWIEANNRDVAERALWYLVACFDADERAKEK